MPASRGPVVLALLTIIVCCLTASALAQPPQAKPHVVRVVDADAVRGDIRDRVAEGHGREVLPVELRNRSGGGQTGWKQHALDAACAQNAAQLRAALRGGRGR